MTKPTDEEIERAMPAILAQAGEQARMNSAISAQIVRNRIVDEVARAKAENLWPVAPSTIIDTQYFRLGIPIPDSLVL